MDLVENYVHAVKAYLHQGEQQSDIVEELSANLRAAVEDRETELGRPLSEPEMEQLLQTYGHPLIVAGRYRAGQAGLSFGRQLISPILFPLYLRALWILIGIGCLIHVLVLVALGAIGMPLTAQDIVNGLVIQFVAQFAVVTCGFVAADHMLPTMQWKAQKTQKTRRVEITRVAASPAQRQDRVPLPEAIAQLIALVAVAIWLPQVYAHPGILFGSAASTYRFGPVWQQILLPTALVFAINVIQAVVNVFRPRWVYVQLVTRVFTDLAGLGILLYLFHADQWIALVHPTQALGASLGSINQWVFYSLLPTALGFLIVALVDLRKLIRYGKARAALPSNT